MKNIIDQKGNILIMVVLISMIAVTFFVFLMGYSLRNIDMVHNLENTTLAYYAAEGGLERSLIEYMEKGTIDTKENICTKFTDLGDAIYDFFQCQSGDYIGELHRVATRYKPELEGYLDRYSITEYWFSDDEIESNKRMKALQSIKVYWNRKDNESAEIEIILARWPKDSPKNVQTARVKPEGDTYLVKEFLPETREDIASRLDTSIYNYILFIKTFDQPTHYVLKGLNNTRGNDSGVIELPDKVLTVLSKATIEDKSDSNINITRSLKLEKELYTDFDSDFDYSRHLID